MVRYDTILFDLDGTLTDPKMGITKSIQYALTSFGIDVPDPALLEKCIGPPLQDSFPEFFGLSLADTDRAIKKYREYFSEIGLYENEVYPGIPDLLDALANDGRELLLATSKPTLYSRKILEHFSLRRYFSFIAGSTMSGSRLRKADIIRYGLGKRPPAKGSLVAMVGDRKHDIIGAKEAGVDSIGVLYGYGSLVELQASSPDHIVADVEGLKSLFLAGGAPPAAIARAD